MCGIVGIIGGSPVNQAIYDGLTLLQHVGKMPQVLSLLMRKTVSAYVKLMAW